MRGLQDIRDFIARLALKFCFSPYTSRRLLPLVVRPSEPMTHATVELITFFVEGKAARLQQ
jgi:hypothetical protein